MMKIIVYFFVCVFVVGVYNANASKNISITRDSNVSSMIFSALRRTGDPICLAAVSALSNPVANNQAVVRGGQRRVNVTTDAAILGFYSVRAIYLTALCRVVDRVADEGEIDFINVDEFLDVVAARYAAEVKRLVRAYKTNMAINIDLDCPECSDYIFRKNYAYDGPRAHHSWSVSKGTSNGTSSGFSAGGSSMSHSSGTSTGQSYTNPGKDVFGEIRKFTGITLVGDRLIVDADATGSPYILSAAGGGVLWDGAGKIGNQHLKISEERQYKSLR